ncbi:hypothetical protein ES706_02405 [subsurface metagenome]
MEDKYAAYRTGKAKDLYKHGKCGQGYESERCVNCIRVMGLPLGMLACGKGMVDAPAGEKILMLGPK